MQNICRGLLLLASAAAAAPSRLQTRASSGAPVALVKNGSYYGSYNPQYNQDFFLGVPFAHPPLEDLRFSNPVSLNSTWSGAIPATSYAPVCVRLRPDEIIKLTQETGMLRLWR